MYLTSKRRITNGKKRLIGLALTIIVLFDGTALA